MPYELISDEKNDRRDLPSSRALPLVIEPRSSSTDLLGWAVEHRVDLDDWLVVHGAILLRGFCVGGVEGFEAFATATSKRLMPYVDRAIPRAHVRGRVYSATDYAADYAIFLHSESSFAATFPSRLFFHCVVPADRGGETELADARRVLARLSPDVRKHFAQRGVLYVRNFGGPFGLSWQAGFQTNDRQELEAYCRENAIALEWIAGSRLRTRQVRPALARHPRSDEIAWCNHAAALHVSTLAPKLRDMLGKMVREEDLPSNTYYGDGTSIEPDVLAEIRDAYESEAVGVAWQPGDVLLIDNLLVAHGRQPFIGPRRVVVALADPMSWHDVGRRGDGAR